MQWNDFRFFFSLQFRTSVEITGSFFANILLFHTLKLHSNHVSVKSIECIAWHCRCPPRTEERLNYVTKLRTVSAFETFRATETTLALSHFLFFSPSFSFLFLSLAFALEMLSLAGISLLLIMSFCFFCFSFLFVVWLRFPSLVWLRANWFHYMLWALFSC